MDRRDARLALDLAREWTREGLMPAASLAQLEARHAGDAQAADDPDRETFGASVLYALGGILLGAAVFALLVLLADNGVIDQRETDDVAPWLFLAWGIVCSVAAFAVDLRLRKPRLGDALHVASLVAIVASGIPPTVTTVLALCAVAFAAALVAYRRTRFMVPFLAVVAFNVAVAVVLFRDSTGGQSEDWRFAAWFVFAVVQAGAVAYASKRTAWPWPTFTLAAATLLVAGTFIGAWDGNVEWRPFDGAIEVALALLMGGFLAAGLRLREKGMVLAAALAIAIDAIVFAFDVGELIGGLVAILAVAGLLIWQAGTLRRYLRET